MNIVSIMAHQDDEMRCLGTMLKCRARGDSLAFITVTDGSSGFVQTPDISREAGAEIRHEEMSALAAAVDATYINLREHDEFLYDTPEVRIAIIEALRKSKADVVFTHYYNDYNEDHVTVFSLVRHCAMHACLPVIKTVSPPLATHPAVFLTQPHGPVEFSATHFVDISEFETEKVLLLKKHESQETAMQMAVGVKMGFEKLAGIPDAYWGTMMGCQYAECFIPMPARGAVKPYPVLP